MARPGDKGQRTTHATFAEALAESGLELEAYKVDRFLSDVERVAAIEGCAPDAWTVPLAKGSVRAPWGGYGKVVLHAGFIHCRHRLPGYGQLEENRWYRLPFPDHQPGSRNPPTPVVETWVCACGTRLAITAECERCGPWPGAKVRSDARANLTGSPRGSGIRLAGGVLGRVCLLGCISQRSGMVRLRATPGATQPSRQLASK